MHAGASSSLARDAEAENAFDVGDAGPPYLTHGLAKCTLARRFYESKSELNGGRKPAQDLRE